MRCFTPCCRASTKVQTSHERWELTNTVELRVQQLRLQNKTYGFTSMQMGNQSRRQDAVHFNKRRAREFFKNGYQGFQWPSRSTPA